MIFGHTVGVLIRRKDVDAKGARTNGMNPTADNKYVLACSYGSSDSCSAPVRWRTQLPVYKGNCAVLTVSAAVT